MKENRRRFFYLVMEPRTYSQRTGKWEDMFVPPNPFTLNFEDVVFESPNDPLVY